MPRKNPLDTREAEICSRLVEFRKSIGLSRVTFARKCGLDSSVVTRLDHKLATLRFGTFKKIAIALPVNPVWLALGGGRSQILLKPLEPSFLQCPAKDSDLFSFAYDQHLDMVLTDDGLAALHELNAVQAALNVFAQRMEQSGHRLPLERRQQVSSELARIPIILQSITKKLSIDTDVLEQKVQAAKEKSWEQLGIDRDIMQAMLDNSKSPEHDVLVQTKNLPYKSLPELMSCRS